MIARVALVVGLASVVGCAAGSSASSASESSAAATTTATASSASKALDAELFDDAFPGEGVAYVLVGNVPGSTEACEVTVSREGLTPPKYSWSAISIHPFGASADTVEAHGPVDIPFATTPDQSSDDDAIATTGDETVYTRTSKPGSYKNTKMTLTLDFAPGKVKRYDAIVSADIRGNDVASAKAASCTGLKPTIVLQFSKYEVPANAAMKAWEKDNDENLEDLGVELEGCSLSSPTTIGCDFGNETNEEQLFINFALENGGLGKVLDAQRSSDFDNE